jgi:ankyrin repeat protein
MLASLNGHTDVVKLLLDRGAKIDLQRSDGATALIVAAQNGHEEVIKILLERGADRGIKDNTGKTFLDYSGMQVIKL